MTFRLAAAALLLAAAAPVPPAPPAAVRPVVEAERAFARMAGEQGTAAAFRAFIADDGQMFLPGPTRAKPLLEAGRLQMGPIRWWPVYAGLAASQDLGFTTGPFFSGTGEKQGRGFFFTIWKRQPDGTWRWVMDHGSPQREASPLGPNTPVSALPRAPKRPRAAAAWAWNEVLAAEEALATALAADARAAYAAALAPDGRLLRAGPPPAIGAAAIRAAAAAGPAAVTARHLGGGASAAGDLAYTYGTARWREADGRERKGHYVRVWQHRASGWTLVVDETNAPPGPPPAG